MLKFVECKMLNILKIYQRSFSLTFIIKKNEICACKDEPFTKDFKYEMGVITPDTEQPHVIIIGAGIAGLSAARKLKQCGITNFKILEATDSPGGRVKTCCIGHSNVELGSDTISGASIANSMYTFAIQTNLLNNPTLRVIPEKVTFFTSEGRAIDFNLAKKASDIFNGFESIAAKIFCTETKVEKQSLNDFLVNLIQKELNKLPEIERYDATRIFYGMLTGLKSKIGEDLNKVSSTIFGKLNALPGGNVNLPMGMSEMMIMLAKDLPCNCVYYSKPVSCVRWSTVGCEVPRAVVKCCDGDNFFADYVIVTVSLGVLKQKTDSLFCPGLSANKVEAINNLGFGHIGKIFIHQENPFWVPSSGQIQFAWSPQELNEREDWMKGVTGFSSVRGSSKILQATIAGHEAKLMESSPVKEVMEELTRLLRGFLGDNSVAPPKEIMRTNWSMNPYFFGSFTYLGVDSTLGDIRTIAEPLPEKCEEVQPIILFAGEHTSWKSFSTMHGARESGIREADRIIEITNKLQGRPGKPCVNEYFEDVDDCED